jgi:hypothetical protein
MSSTGRELPLPSRTPAPGLTSVPRKDDPDAHFPSGPMKVTYCLDGTFRAAPAAPARERRRCLAGTPRWCSNGRLLGCETSSTRDLGPEGSKALVSFSLVGANSTKTHRPRTVKTLESNDSGAIEGAPGAVRSDLAVPGSREGSASGLRSTSGELTGEHETTPGARGGARGPGARASARNRRERPTPLDPSSRPSHLHPVVASPSLPAQEVDGVINGGIGSLNRRTETSPGRLAREIQRIRAGAPQWCRNGRTLGSETSPSRLPGSEGLITPLAFSLIGANSAKTRAARTVKTLAIIETAQITRPRAPVTSSWGVRETCAPRARTLQRPRRDPAAHDHAPDALAATPCRDRRGGHLGVAVPRTSRAPRQCVEATIPTRHQQSAPQRPR